MDKQPHIIAVLSGKGGAGKTLVSVNLAAVAGNAVYLDCDVEEPNGHLFFKPELTNREPVRVSVPEVDADLCTGCRKCVDFCRYNALALVGKKLMVFEEVCHSCNGCVLLCPERALSERKREIGEVEDGKSCDVRVLTGRLHPGEVSGVPVIHRLMEQLPKGGTAVIDCPPGSACAVMESIRAADFCVLVAEPTLFGAHNLAMVVELVELFQKPFGVVLNKRLDGEDPSERYCRERKIRILGRIPYDDELGKLCAKGLVAVRESEAYRALFAGLLQEVNGGEAG